MISSMRVFTSGRVSVRCRPVFRSVIARLLFLKAGIGPFTVSQIRLDEGGAGVGEFFTESIFGHFGWGWVNAGTDDSKRSA